MVWIFGAIGLLVGIVSQSWNTAILYTIVGAYIGYLIQQKQSTNKTPTELDSQNHVLASRIDQLKAQVDQLNQRLVAMEEKWLGKSSSAAPAPMHEVTPTAPADSIQPTPSITSPQPARAAPPPIARTQILATAAPIATPTVTRSNPTPAEPTVAAPRPLPRPQKPAAPPSALRLFVQRWVIGGNPLVKIGVLILFLGLGFLLRYAAAHAVLPIEWRYAGVAAAGIGLLLGGWRWRHKQDNYGLILQGAGIGVLYLTTLAAMRLHPLLPLEAGFAVLIVVAVFAALLAVLQNALPLAVAAALGGFAAPVLASTGGGNHVALFSYLALLNSGIVAIAWFRAWRLLNLIGFVCSFLLGSLWAAKYYRPELFATTEPFLLLLFVMYVLITFLFAQRTLRAASLTDDLSVDAQLRQSAASIGYVDGTLAFGVPIVVFSLQYLLMKPFEYGASLSALGFGLAYAALAMTLFRHAGKRYLLLTETLIAIGVIFGSLAIPLGLEDKWTSAAWAVEAAGVYWIGIRQQRLHARLFALLLTIGAAIYFAFGLQWSDQGAVLSGSWLGCVLLALSAGSTCRLMKQAGATSLHDWEIRLRPALIGFGAFFAGVIPFLLLPMEWASAALAVIGTAALFLSLRWNEPWLLRWGCLFQALSGLLFMTTLHRADGHSVLSNGWSGLFTASLIGAGMLASLWIMLAQRKVRSDHPPAVAFGIVASIGLLAGLAFINLAPLFVLPWRIAAMVWPLSGLVTLWLAIRLRHKGAIVFGLILQAIAGFAWLNHQPLLSPELSSPLTSLTPFIHSGFLGPLLISIAAFFCARLLQRTSTATNAASNANLGWIALLWAGIWWAFAWTTEIARVTPHSLTFASLIALVVITAWSWSTVARRWNWTQLGTATFAYLPALVLISISAWMTGIVHPAAAWGWLAWPAALLMHLLLLRRQAEWGTRSLVEIAHIAGTWLFVIQAASELRWQFAQWGEADSAWSLLGWMIVPAAFLWALTLPRVQRSWPLRDFRIAYLLRAAIPVALYLLGWVWISNAVSDGSAAPLPYLPLLNPLEIAHGAALLAVVLWWWPLRAQGALRNHDRLAIMLIGSTAFIALSGIVARSCHHWGNIEWRLSALLASGLFQTSISIVWSALALGLMLIAHRTRQRVVWITGASLIAVVVGKLFLIELSSSGSLTRIVSFIVVGLLLLVIGYFAPLPPKFSAPSTAEISS